MQTIHAQDYTSKRIHPLNNLKGPSIEDTSMPLITQITFTAKLLIITMNPEEIWDLFLISVMQEYDSTTSTSTITDWS